MIIWASSQNDPVCLPTALSSLCRVCLGGKKAIRLHSRSVQPSKSETGKETQRWHRLAASLADIDSSVSRPGLCFSIAHGRADQVAAAVQDFSCKLGRIEGLVQELDSLRLDCPALSSVTAHNRHVSLVFLGLEAEVKFSVQIDIGE